MYTITLTRADVDTIAFVGYRYGWSDSLSTLVAGDNELTEPQAWEIRDAIESDMEGGHDAFPMLNPHSALADTIYRLYMDIV